MAGVGESSSTQKEVGEKPVIVRVKRKVGHSPLDAFWLEINERPSKRQFLNFSKLSISQSEKKEELKPKKVLVRHLESVTESETPSDIIHSFFESDLNDQSCSKGKFENRKIAFKKDNRKEQRLTKAVQQQQAAAQNARFKQIWRRREEYKDGIIYDEDLQDRCDFFDVVRVDAEEKPNSAPEVTSLEDQKLLASFLPLLRECIPTAAAEIETDIHSSDTDEYVYDFYATNEEMDISEDTSKHQLPLVKVEEEEEFCIGPDSSDYDSDDSNAEDHPRNDYPEEMSDEEEEEEDEEDEDEEEEEEKSEASDESKDEESSARHVRMVLDDDDDDEFFDGHADDVNVYGDSDDELEYRS